MDRVRTLIAKVAPTQSTVLILGETGTGKELVARAVHDQSPRAASRSLRSIAARCPKRSSKASLFGHRKGAFTGADEHRVGLFEVANNGTIFLDEIGELPKAMQAKLLRVLESREIRRVGENRATNVDVRVVCATHRDLPEMVATGDFREDLMYRINTFEIFLPPLRDRVDDIAELAEHLLEPISRQGSRATNRQLADDAIAILKSHVWPGNVRELANVIEHATILCEDGPITAAHLPAHFNRRQLTGAAATHPGPISLRDLEMQAIYQRFGTQWRQQAEELPTNSGSALRRCTTNLTRPAT